MRISNLRVMVEAKSLCDHLGCVRGEAELGFICIIVQAHSRTKHEQLCSGANQLFHSALLPNNHYPDYR